MLRLSGRLSRVILVAALTVALYAVVNLAPAALEIGDLAGASPWPSFRALMDRFSPYPTAGWAGPFYPQLRPLTAADTHFLVADAACTTTTIATDADCWSHTSGGAGGAGVPGSGNAARLDAGSGAGAFTVDANMSAASWVQTGFTGTINMGSFTLTLSGNMDISAGTFNRDTSTVVFAANATLTMVANNINRALYNVTVNAGVSLTNATNTAWISNILTVNGTLLGGSPNDPQRILFVSGEGATDSDGDGEAEMLILGASADVDSSGYLIMRARGASGTVYEIPGGTYQHPAVQGGNSAVSYTINQRGNINTPLCGVFRDCAYLMSSEATLTPAAQFTYNTNNFNITVGGTIWIGDGGTTGGTFNAGSSAIESYGFAPTGDNVVVNLQTATMTIHPSSTYTPLAWYDSYSVRVNFNSANVTVHGGMRMGWSPAGNTTVWDLGSATITVTDNEGGACGIGCAGEFNIVQSTNYLIMGSATLTVEDRWTNNTTNTNWDVGTSTVILAWDHANTDGTVGAHGHYFIGPTNLPEAEFYNLRITVLGAVGSTVVAIDDSPPWGPVWAANELRLTDTDGGSLTLNMQNQNITMGGAGGAALITVETNTTLTMGTGNLLDVNRLDVDGTLSMDSITVANIDLSLDLSATFQVTAWTAYDLAAATFDVRWTFGTISDASATLTVTVGELTHTVRTDYTLARNGTSRVEERVGASDTTVTLRRAGGWGSTDAMAMTAADAPAGGGGGEPPRPFPYWALVLLLGAAFIVYTSVRSRKRRRHK